MYSQRESASATGVTMTMLRDGLEGWRGAAAEGEDKMIDSSWYRHCAGCAIRDYSIITTCFR